MDQLLERYSLSKLTQEIDNPISLYLVNKSIINNLPNRNYKVQMGSLVNSTKHLRKKLYELSAITFRIYK